MKIKAKSKMKIKAKSKVKRRRKRNQRKIHPKILLLKNLIQMNLEAMIGRRIRKRRRMKIRSNPENSQYLVLRLIVVKRIHHITKAKTVCPSLRDICSLERLLKAPRDQSQKLPLDLQKASPKRRSLRASRVATKMSL